MRDYVLHVAPWLFLIGLGMGVCAAGVTLLRSYGLSRVGAFAVGAFLWFLAALFYFSGFFAGLLVRGALWLCAAMVAGFKDAL